MQKTFELPAGRYYVGDPCYVFEKTWDVALELTDCFSQAFEVKDRTDIPGAGWMAASDTLYGDGCYDSSHMGFKFPVDAGMIGVVQEGLVLANATPEQLACIWDPAMSQKPDEEHLGVWVTFPCRFVLRTIDGDGRMCIGHIVVLTGGNQDEDDEPPEEYGANGYDEPY